jgi:WD40 repeat protein
MGPPERLSLPCGNALGQSRDGRVIVSCSRAVDFQKAYAGAWILHADRPNQPIRIDPGADIVHIAVSPDGRWVVTVNHNPAGLVRVWDAHDGKRVKQLAEWGGIGYPRFSPDGNWLSTGLDGGRLFAVGTWEPGPRVGGVGTFAPDSQLLAITTSAGNLRLVVPATGRELATLEDPSQDGSNAPFFTPDGAKLIALSSGKVTGIRVWDLRLIRQQLVTMRLDWDAPPYPPADPVKSLVPLKLEVRRGNPAFEGGVEIEPPPQVKR